MNISPGSAPRPGGTVHADRMDVIERRNRATDEALRRRADELAGHRRELAERARRIPGELSRARVLAGTDLADGLRRLRDDTRTRLSDPDYPDRLAAATSELGTRYLRRVAELHTAVAARTLAGLDTAVPRFTAGRWTPPVTAPPARGRRQEGLIWLGAVPAGYGLIRLGWIGGPPSPVIAGIAVSAALAVACWATRTRRAAARRTRLTRWTAELLADTRQSLEMEYNRRELEVEPQVRGLLVELSARLEQQVAAHERAVRTVRGRRGAVGR